MPLQSTDGKYREKTSSNLNLLYYKPFYPASQLQRILGINRVHLLVTLICPRLVHIHRSFLIDEGGLHFQRIIFTAVLGQNKLMKCGRHTENSLLWETSLGFLIIIAFALCSCSFFRNKGSRILLQDVISVF